MLTKSASASVLGLNLTIKIINGTKFSRRNAYFVTATAISDVVVAPFLKRTTRISLKFINNCFQDKNQMMQKHNGSE